MRFTPTAFFGGQLGPTFIATAQGASSGSFISGGIDYGFIKFSSGSYTLNVNSGAEVDLLLVGGGAAGDRTGGGGGGVFQSSTRLYKGTYTVIAGRGGTSGSLAVSSSISANGIRYEALPGSITGSSGQPTSFAAGANSDCGGSNLAGGGGASAAQNGFNSTCTPSIVGGNGGQGLTLNFDGTSSVYASGGGGRGRATAGGLASGGAGGTNAGNGGSFVAAATSAINGFGGGGGGGYTSVGSGGHGVVIIRYRR